MKTEPANICARCDNLHCIIQEANSQTINIGDYPEITACNDFDDIESIGQKAMDSKGAGMRNVEMIRNEGVRIVKKIPLEVRRELRAGVCVGELGHLKKDGLLPEVYFHPDKQKEAMEIRQKSAMRSIEAIRKVCVKE